MSWFCGVERVRRRAAGVGGRDHVAIGIVVVRRAADLRVLVHVVGRVHGRHAVDDRLRAVAGRVVEVRLVLVGNGRVGRDENGVRQLADRVIGVRPRAVHRGLGDAAAEAIIGVVEPRVDRPIGGDS